MADPFITIDVKGFRELSELMKVFPKNLQKRVLGGAVAAGSAVVVSEAKAHAPVAEKPHRAYSGRYTVLPGALRASISARRIRDKAATVMNTVGPRKAKGIDTFYWRFVEFGTRLMAARPFLRPALHDNVARVIEAVRVRLEKGVDREVRRMGYKSIR
jgi:HK97 gp10 family phage protein